MSVGVGACVGVCECVSRWVKEGQKTQERVRKERKKRVFLIEYEWNKIKWNKMSEWVYVCMYVKECMSFI